MYYQRIDFNSSAVVTLRWQDFMDVITAKSLPLQYITNVDGYTVFALDNNITYKSLLVGPDDSPSFQFSPDYSQAQNDTDTLDFVNNHLATTNQKTNQTSSISNVQTTSDGRWSISPNSFPGWVTLYFAGSGDDVNNGIGQGTLFQLSSDAASDGYATWQFNDITFILGATLIYTGASIGDTVDYQIFAPATVTGAGSTQVNLSNVGPGNIIVPSAGAGMTTIDITQAVPVPNISGTGFWDWSGPPTGWGTVTANATQTGMFDLFDFPITLAHPAIQIPIIGSSKTFELLVESVTSMQVLPQWMHKAVLHNSGHTGLQLGWVLSIGRAKTV